MGSWVCPHGVQATPKSAWRDTGPQAVTGTARTSFPGDPKMPGFRDLQGVILQERSESYLPASGMPLHVSPQPRRHHHTRMWGTDSSSQRGHGTLEEPATSLPPGAEIHIAPVSPAALPSTQHRQAASRIRLMQKEGTCISLACHCHRCVLSGTVMAACSQPLGHSGNHRHCGGTG